MSDKKAKFIKKLVGKEKERILVVMDRILMNDLVGLDVRKLSGYDDLFRVRVGRVRIIFQSVDSKNVIIHVTWRDDQTYRDF